jgi:hypothetical protein
VASVHAGIARASVDAWDRYLREAAKGRPAVYEIQEWALEPPFLQPQQQQQPPQRPAPRKVGTWRLDAAPKLPEAAGSERTAAVAALQESLAATSLQGRTPAVLWNECMQLAS